MGSFFRNISQLALSRGVSVALGLVATPIVARLYLPETFGAYGVVSAAASWLSAFATLGYFNAIPMASTKNEAKTLVKLCLGITVVLTLLFTGVFGFGGKQVAQLLKEPQLASLMWFVPLLFLLDSLYSVTDSTLSRQGRFGTVAVASFLSSNLPRVITIMWALVLGAGVLGLFAGYVLGTGISLAIASVITWHELYRRKDDQPTPPVSYRQVIKEHVQFPKINMWNGLLRVSTSRMPVFVLAIYFDPTTVGYFTMASSVISIPLRIMGSSISQVFYPEAAREWEESGAVKRALHFALKFQATMGVFPLVALGLLAPLFFEVVFGFRWREAGVLCQLLSFMMLTNLLVGPLMPLFLIRKEAGTLFVLSLVQLVVTGIALVAGGMLDSSRLAIGLYSAGVGLVFLYMLFKILRAGKAEVASNLFSVLKEVIFSIITLAPASLLYYLAGWRWGAMGLCVVGLLAYVALLCWRDREIYERLLRIKNRLLHRPSPEPEPEPPAGANP